MITEGESTLGVSLFTVESGFYFHLAFFVPYSMTSSCWASTERNNQLGALKRCGKGLLRSVSRGPSLNTGKGKKLVFRSSSC